MSAMARLCRAALLCGLVGLWATPSVRAETITVFAAASTKNALDEVAEAFATQTDRAVRISYAGSAQIARQIEAGAPADIAILADTAWMEVLAAGGLIEDDTRFDLLGNTLVVIAHGKAAPLEVVPGFDLAGRVGEGRLAMALVDAVPAGRYGKAALETLGVWDLVAPRVAQADNVRAALAFVSTGEAPLGIVYVTDAAAEDDVTVIGTFPAGSHPPIVYPVAALREGDRTAAATFLGFLRSDAARAAFERQGFVVLVE